MSPDKRMERSQVPEEFDFLMFYSRTTQSYILLSEVEMKHPRATWGLSLKTTRLYRARYSATHLAWTP